MRAARTTEKLTSLPASRSRDLKLITRWEDIPADWACPECGVGKADFEMVELA